MRYVLPALSVASGPRGNRAAAPARGGATSPAPRGGKTQRQDAAGCYDASGFLQSSLPYYECWPFWQTQLCSLKTTSYRTNQEFCTHQPTGNRAAGREAGTPRLVGACERQARGFAFGGGAGCAAWPVVKGL